ncbi:MAG: 3-hydroxyacyl-CoA dehydrogenase NAD-binding domain-containing protein [Granulosicoccus sp.]
MANAPSKSNEQHCVENSHPINATMTANPVMNGSEKVSLSMHGGVAVLTINNPPVNAGSTAVRMGLLSGLEYASRQNASAAVIHGAGRCFVAGSDLREFGKPLCAPELPDVIKAIESARFPVIAALHGVALGGGLELALGCDYRIAAPETQLGLPEVSLGFVPGAGGTQRLPRLIGLSTAISMICSASRIPAKQALEIGLVDALADKDLLESALNFINSQRLVKRMSINLAAPYEEPSIIEAAESKANKRGRGRPNIAAAIRLIKAASTACGVETLAEERRVFQDLRISDDAFALRYLFFSERRASSVETVDLKNARSISVVGIIGGGTMGQGIARAFLAAGISVIIMERDHPALQRAQENISKNLQTSVARGRLTPEDCTARLQAFNGTIEMGDLTACDLVIEAVFEDMDVKKDILLTLEKIVSPEITIATNTSYLDINEMSQNLAHPERVLGLHFFSPADIMPLLEVVRGARTSNTTLATGLKLAHRLKKQPVVSQVAEGFIGNRIYNAYRRRAELLVLDGTTPDSVDKAAQEFGFAMGPFLVSDMSGLDIAWAMRKRHASTRDPAARYVNIADRLCEAGRLGRKTTKGWYDYDGDIPKVSPEVQNVIDTARREAGISHDTIHTDVIQRQLLAAIVNEAALVLEEGVAQRPSDVDVTFTNGYGFPRWRGGPLYWASKQDPEMLQADLDTLADAIGYGHRIGPVNKVLEQLNALNGD